MSITNLTDRERELAAEVERLRTDAKVMGLALVDRDAEIERLQVECEAIEAQAVKNCDEVLALREQLAAARPAPAVPLVTDDLPPLPKPFMELHREIVPAVYSLWASQMHAYAAAAVAQEREQRRDELSDALQSDLENGVKWLNEKAAIKFYREYPELAAAIRKGTVL